MSGEPCAVLHVVAGLDPRHGGPSRTVVALTDALARRGDVAVRLVSQGRTGAPAVASAAGVKRLLPESGSRAALALGLPVRRELVRMGLRERPALVHNHGLWHPVNHWAAWAARAWGVPLVVHPRGMLEPWALEQKRHKKRLALALFQQRDLDSAQALVATSEMELENLRAFGLRQPIAVIPNGVELPPSGAVDARKGRNPEAGTRTALFLSRVHPKKGVLELVRAWAALRPEGWRLYIAGPDEGGHWREVSRLIAELGLAGVIEYLGPVEAQAKAAAYRDADLFVLPSFSENFGVVIAEALAYGVPVITTRATPWAELETHHCGWWIETGVEALAGALREAMNMDDDQRRAMGARGRELARRYDWNEIAGQTAALYRWLLGYEERPECVRI